MTLAELEQVCSEGGQKTFVAKQLARWLYKHHATEISEMSNLSLVFRKFLEEHFLVGRSAFTKVDVSKDGTKKYLFGCRSGEIETAVIPDEERMTVCVSSQSGCRYGCRFCATGSMGFRGNLSTGEILNQLFSVEEADKISNVVYMGMGEPFDNTDEVLKSLEILTSPWGMAWSPTRITVSTIGIIPGMQRFLEETKVNLALSLHSPFDEERKWLMPVEHIYPIRDVVEVLKEYSFTKHHRLTIEYILFHQVNDSPQHALKLARIANEINARVNLIHFHNHEHSDFQGADRSAMLQFQGQLQKENVTTTIRKSKGFDISAACGLLVLKNKA